jgi:hypothetical protein
MSKTATTIFRLIKELQAFPHGRHDDQVDSIRSTLSNFVFTLIQRGRHQQLEHHKIRKQDSWPGRTGQGTAGQYRIPRTHGA